MELTTKQKELLKSSEFINKELLKRPTKSSRIMQQSSHMEAMK